MKVRQLPNPYVVLAPWSHETHDEMSQWLKDHMQHYFYAYGDDNMQAVIGTPIPDDAEDRDKYNEHEWAVNEVNECFMFLFECPKDALLFKLTWCDGNGKAAEKN